MKKRNAYFIFLLPVFILPIFVFGDLPSEPGNCKNEKYTTAEPGTCLDPRAYRLLKALEKVETNPYNNEFARKVINIFEPNMKCVKDTQVRNGEISVPIRIYYPTKWSTENPSDVIFFIHGGGFMYGSIEEYDMAVKKLAKVTEKIVIALDYRLAPEYPYPAALNDVSAVFEWIIQNLNIIGGKGKKITVMGDSAGANLATVLTLKARDEGNDHILCQVLYYPPTTFVELEFPSRLYFFRDKRRTYMISEDFVRESKASYLPDSIDETLPYLSPLEADLSGDIPPVLMLNAQVDPIRDDGRLYAEKLREYGQEVSYVEYPGILHGFFNLYMIFNEGKESMKLVKEFIDEQ